MPKDRSQAKAEEFYNKVVAKVRALVQDTLHKWQMAGFERERESDRKSEYFARVKRAKGRVEGRIFMSRLKPWAVEHGCWPPCPTMAYDRSVRMFADITDFRLWIS